MYKAPHFYAMSVVLYFAGMVLLDRNVPGLGIMLIICALGTTWLGMDASKQADKKARAERIRSISETNRNSYVPR